MPTQQRKKAAAPRAGSKAAAPRAGSQESRRASAREVATQVVRELQDLTGKEPESIVSLSPDDDGWVVSVEVVESRRIPDSTDILAVYEVHAGSDGSLRSYERTHRYIRGRTNDE